MKEFGGFPARMEFTPIPNLFFSSLLLEINDIAELKTTLFVLAALYRKRGYPRFVTHRELQDNTSLMRSLKSQMAPPEEVLRRALGQATRRGTLLHLKVEKDESAFDIYLLNTEQNKAAISKIKSGQLVLGELKLAEPVSTESREPPDIFTLYEENIGMLTPLTAESLKEAERLYPKAWVRDAISEAVSLNKRNWRYIEAILEHWSSEGRTDGTYKRGSKEKAGPDRYTKGKYGHMVRH